MSSLMVQRFAGAAVLGSVGLLMLFIPRISRRGMLFAVPVPDGFRDRPEARQAIKAYQLQVAIALAVVILAITTTPIDWAAPMHGAGVLLLTFAAMWAHLHQHRALLPYAIQPRGVPQVDLSNEPDRLPVWVWLNVLFLLLIAGVGFYLNAHWDSIPERFPVHWGINGQVDRWSSRTPEGVFGPLMIAGLQVLLLGMLQVATWFGSRRSPMRVLNVQLLFAVGMVMAGSFSLVALAPLVRIAPWGVALGVGSTVMILLLVRRMLREASENPVEPTPNECWRGGMIYNNPDDAALFVERRDGLGFTFNFANSWAWIILSVTLLMAFTPLLLIPR